MSRLQTESRQIVPHHRCDRVINKRVHGGSDVTADFQYRCEVFNQPEFNPGVRLFESAETYRNFYKILFFNQSFKI